MWLLDATYQVTTLSGAASEDEDDTGARAGRALGEIVAGDAATAEKLASFERELLRSRESRGRGGQESSGDGELHVGGVVGKILL